MFVSVDIGNLDMIVIMWLVDGNLCGNLGIVQGRLSNIYCKW